MYRSFEDTQKIASDFFLLPRACSMFESLCNAFCLLWYLIHFEPLLYYLRGCRSGKFAQNELRIPVRRGENHSHKFSGFFLQKLRCYVTLKMSKTDFFEKHFVLGLLDQKSPKWTQNEVFQVLWKINLWNFSDFCMKSQQHKTCKCTWMIVLGKILFWGSWVKKGQNGSNFLYKVAVL